MNQKQGCGITCDLELLYFSVVNNVDYFYYIRKKYWYGEKFVIVLRELLSQLHWYEENLKTLYQEAQYFDFDEAKGNGFRSFCLIFDRYFSECYDFCKRLSAAHHSMFFRPDSYLREAEGLVNILIGLRPGLKLISKIMTDNENRSLLMPEKCYTAEELIIECGDISQLGFYGRNQGFYYCTSMRRILQGVGVIVATFSDLYQSSGGPISKAALTILNGMKYILNPELRAKQIVDVAQNSSIEFLKAFWSLSETQFMKALPGWVCPKLQVREEIFIPPVPVLVNVLNSDKVVVIPPPTSHIPVAPVRCLLLSSAYRDGQLIQKTKSSTSPKVKSKCLLFHCHGGGFISQNPESHEIYLRHWAHDLNVPIISVDYSLAPQAPFPRALEEVLLAYAWVLNNPEKLGWSGENICFAGDSAGGNILMGVVLKAISLGIRLPDLVLCAYTPLILDIVPSPSRLLCWIDPLLPLGFMISCLDAYCGALETDCDEYVENPGSRSRKISSISDILDSSMNFIKQCQRVDVDAYELSDSETDSAFYSSDTSDSSNSYINGFSQLIGESCKKDAKESFSKEISVYDLTKDIAFDLKTKLNDTLNFGINKVSQVIMSSPLYKKVIVPFLPNWSSPYQEQKKYECPPKSFILEKIRKLKIVSKNPFMSPLLASDDLLKRMPPIQFVSLNFDPCLDDSIAFAKRLKSLNCQVVIDVLDGLPHGFLNFLPFSKEAHDGSNLCVRRLKEAMKLS